MQAPRIETTSRAPSLVRAKDVGWPLKTDATWSIYPLHPYFRKSAMLAKLTSKNQLTLPKSVLSHCKGAQYFDVSEENGRIVLTPVRLNKADAVRSKLAELGLREEDVADAVNWARQPQRS